LDERGDGRRRPRAARRRRFGEASTNGCSWLATQRTSEVAIVRNAVEADGREVQGVRSENGGARFEILGV